MSIWQRSVSSGILSLAMAMTPLGLSGAAQAQAAKATPAARKKASPKAPAKAPAKTPAPKAPAPPAPPPPVAPDDALEDAPPEPEVPLPEDDTGLPPDDPALPPDVPAGTVDNEPDEPPLSATPPPDGASHRLWGTVMIAGGAVLGLVGAGVLISTRKDHGKKDKTLVPTLMMGAGALSCIPGIALLNAGEAEGLKYDRWKEDRSELGASRRRLSPALVWQRSF